MGKREALLEQIGHHMVLTKKVQAAWKQQAQEHEGTEFEEITADLAGDATVMVAHLEEARARLLDA